MRRAVYIAGRKKEEKRPGLGPAGKDRAGERDGLFPAGGEERRYWAGSEAAGRREGAFKGRACVPDGRMDSRCRAVVSLVLLPLALLVGRARLLPYCCVQETTVNAL